MFFTNDYNNRTPTILNAIKNCSIPKARVITLSKLFYFHVGHTCCDDVMWNTCYTFIVYCCCDVRHLLSLHAFVCCYYNARHPFFFREKKLKKLIEIFQKTCCLLVTRRKPQVMNDKFLSAILHEGKKQECEVTSNLFGGFLGC